MKTSIVPYRFFKTVKINFFKRVCLMAMLFVLPFVGGAAEITSDSTGNWNNASIWNGGIIPTAGDDVIVGSSWHQTITLTGDVVCNNLTIQNDNTLNLNGHTLTVSGNLLINERSSLNVGSGNLTIEGDYSNSEGNNSGIEYTNGTVTIQGNITTNANWGRHAFVCDGSGWLVMSGENKTWTANSAITIPYFRVGSSTLSKAGSGTITISNQYDHNCITTDVISGFTVSSAATQINKAGSESCGPAGPEIVVSPTSLSNFTYCNDSGPSVAQSFTVSGTNLTDSISITPPAGYEISLTSGGPYQTSSLTLTESEGAVPATPIYVRLQQGLSTGDKTGNIEITSTDADNKTVALTGEVAGAVITVSNATLSGFSYCDGHGPSNWQSYTVSGVCLSENITITAPTNYEISTSSGSGYTSSLSLTQSGGNVNTTTIYVRLKAGLNAASYNGETITHTSSGATQQNVSCSGTVSPLPLVALASASQVSAANVQQYAQKHVLSAFTLAVTDATATVSSIAFTSSGTYDAADITKFQLWYNTSNSLSGASQIGSDITSSLGTGAHTFSSLARSISAGNTGYFWITANFAPAATIGNTIAVSSITTSDITLSSCGSKSGSITAGGTQTIIESTGTVYYSRASNNWNSSSTWSTEGCGGTAASSYPGATDIVIICNGNIVTANVDITTNESVTVQSGGTLTVSDNIEIDAVVTIETGGTMNWPSTIEIGSNANITVNGNISAGSTTIVYQDDYAGPDNGKITATGTMAFSRVKSSSSVKGGSLQATSITIGTYGENEVGVDMAFHGPTTISTYLGYGDTYFTNGDLTITTYNSNNSTSVPLNEIISHDSDLIFTNKVTAKNSSLQTNIDGNIYFNAGFENAYTSSPDMRLIADTIFIATELKGEGNTNTYLEANVVQSGNVAINQNSDGNIFIKNDFDSDGYETDFNNTNATFKIEGNSTFDNITGHLNSSASLITLGNSFMGGTGTFGANDGPIYVGGQLVIDQVQVSFQGSAYGYIGNVYAASEFVTEGTYSGVYNDDETVGGSGNHPRDANNDPNENEGKYISIAGGQITEASMIKELSEAEAAGLDIQPESWSEPFPIELSEFYAEITEYSYVEIFWETQTETNNDFFTLYRSNNGVDFIPIAEISGAGTSTYQNWYSYLDASFYPGISYYKLTQTDYDGTTSTSKTIAIYRAPNNVTYKFLGDKVQVSFADNTKRYHVMISGSDGKIHFSQGYQNITETEIALPHEAGVYIISTLSSNTIINQKFVR